MLAPLNKLFPFQEEAVSKMVHFLMGATGGVYNACEQGLGKCLQTIEACRRINAKAPLVICPKSVKLVWASEIKKWRASGEWTIASYDDARLRKIPNEFFDVLICDECQYLKTHDSQRTQAVLNYYLPTVPHSIFLSGTPFLSCITDCWPVFSRLSPSDFGDYWKFAYTYAKVIDTPWGHKLEGLKNHEQLKKIITDKFFFRFTKEQVLKDLPPKILQEIPLPAHLAVKLTPDEEKLHTHYLEVLKGAIAKGTPAPYPPVSITQKRKEQGLKKIPRIVEFCKEILDNKTPLVIFGWHLEVIHELIEKLVDYDPVFITGQTSDKLRAEAVRKFQEGETLLFIGQLAAAGVGITLTAASTVVSVELDWNPPVNQQAWDRCHRIGQLNNVTVYIPIVKGSVDERVMEVVISKNLDFKSVLD